MRVEHEVEQHCLSSPAFEEPRSVRGTDRLSKRVARGSCHLSTHCCRVSVSLILFEYRILILLIGFSNLNISWNPESCLKFRGIRNLVQDFKVVADPSDSPSSEIGMVVSRGVQEKNKDQQVATIVRDKTMKLEEVSSSP